MVIGGPMRKTSNSLLLVAFVLLLSLVGCKSDGTPGTNSPTPAVKQDKVAVVIPVTIDAFDRLEAGIRSKLGGRSVDIKIFSAEGDPAKFETVIKSALLSRPDYLVTVGTQLTNTAFGPQFKGQLPTVIAAAISDPSIVESLTTVGLEPPRSAPVAIISDTPREDSSGLLAKTLMALKPGVKKVGVLYNLSELNSKATAEGVIKAVESNGITALKGILSGPDDVDRVTRDLLLKGAQVIVIPLDKYAVGKAATVVQLARSNNVPTFSLDDGTVQKSGVLAAVSVDYGLVGEKVGDTISEIIQGKAKAQDIPIIRLEKASIYLNESAAHDLQITIPDDIKTGAVIVKPGS
jgi:putative tryptophan/tyrosine transport system substrate-binding protein